MTQSAGPEAGAGAGAAYYARLSLFIYDTWVLLLSCSLAWRCPTRKTLLPFFKSHVGANHLDIGVGTGYFPACVAGDPNTPLRDLTLVDLNPDCLDVARERIMRTDRDGLGLRSGLHGGTGVQVKTKTVVADALRPHVLSAEEEKTFDSISLVYILHTLPGNTEAKASALFRSAKIYLRDEGVLFGATVLGYSVRHNLFGRVLLRLYNWMGIFDNKDDGEEGIVAALKMEFVDVETKIVGRVLMFVASRPTNTL